MGVDVNRLARSTWEETSMRIACKTVLKVGLVLFTPFLAVHLNAQITNQINADMTHSFMITSKTLPPGKYVFQMSQGSDLQTMTVSTADGKASDQFMVRQSIAPTTPAHTELVFRRYGDKEFLTKIYEAGNKNGVAVAETSKEEKQLQKQGQKPVEHTETQ
jgi:hypothetical protein